MRIKLGLLIFIMSTSFAFSQTNQLWQTQSISKNTSIKSGKQNLPQTHIYSLNIESMRAALVDAPERSQNSKTSNVILSFPNSEGKFENFRIIEASVLSPELQARYPDIRSYAGQGIEDPTAIIRFSISPLGFQSMRVSANQPASFIEVYSDNLSQYVVFKRADKRGFTNDFECTVTESVNRALNTGTGLRNADDSILRTYRLAVSTTGEYTAYHGGTKALALAAIVNTMTRVNGIFETDFNVTMELVGNTDDVIYTNSGTDPYGNTTSGYNSALQSTLTSEIGEANYDIGHLFANLQNNGNAGCIGCVCVNNQKGSGWTSATIPDGDFFDVDYVAHEMGHQFGGNHTWTHGGNEGSNVQVEPGSGSTIMSYAGITGATDVQANVHPNFHAATIEQITDYIKSTSCQTNTNLGNSVPVVNAGSNYTIPNGTAFVLEGSATDADSGDVLTYSWEQMDENNASTTYPSTTATTGVAFRAYGPTTDNKRYFPRLETTKTGATSWQWEAVPNVARSLNFRLTTRDNRAGGATNSSDDMVVTVNGTAGPFVLNAPNTNVTWNAGTTQNVAWNVAGTTANGVNASNVDIFLSIDGGDTYPIALASGVPNDGSHDIVVPNNLGTQNRIMVRGSNHIFFDISNTNFEIAGVVVCNANVPTGLAASSVNSSTATLSWDTVPGATYDLRYRTVGSSTWTTNAVTGISSGLAGLSVLTQYEAQVRSKCNGGNDSAYSSSVNFTTTDVQLIYCASNGDVAYQTGISRVIFGAIDNIDGPAKDVGYEDFTNISTTVTQSSSEDLTVYVNTDGNYRVDALVWIDWNRNGLFTDSGETYDLGNISNVSNGALPTISVTIPASAQIGNTRMRVSARYNADPTSCQTNFDGEVEDYTIIVEGNGPDTIIPVITLNGASTINLNIGDAYTEQGATASDNIDGDISASIVIGGDIVNTNIAGTYAITYNVSDAAGNNAVEITRTVNVNPDTTVPVITLNGASVININVGDTYTEQGATASDNIDGDISANIVVAGDIVNSNIAGTYTITYNVSDTAGNAAVEVTRTVNVNADITVPVITLNGASTINLIVGDTYTEQGATATDNIDGDITNSILIAGDVVNTNTAGVYVVTYNVSDAANNSATEVIRTINISDPSTGCSGGISSFPYTEGFENTLGAWTQSTADDINWTVDANGTPSNGTGPSSATEGSYYIFVEASGNGTGYPNKQAILNSPCFNLGGLSEATFSFKYHMYGDSDMGSIVLELSDDDGSTWTNIWNQTGNKGNAWQSASVDISAYVGGSVQLRFNRTTGATWQADIAIDDVSLTEGAVVVTGCSGGISSFPYSEGFENTLGAWTQSTADDINWTVDANGTPSSGTGPSSATEGSYYIFVEASGNGTGYPNKQAIINSPCFDLSGQSAATFNFSYHQYGSSDMGTIALEASNDNGVTWVSIWSNSGNLGNSWQSASVDISAYVGESVQLRFNRITGSTWQADIAIDNVILTTTTSLRDNNTSRGETVALNDIKIYPNPVEGNSLNVLSSYDNLKYEIYSVIGQLVSKGNVTNQVIDVSQLESAVYLVQFITEERVVSKRFIKK